MPSQMLAVDVGNPDPRIIEQVAAVLGAGGVVAAPSDTVYGLLGVNGNERARKRLTAIKEREGPFITLVQDIAQARQLAPAAPAWVWERLPRVWPGPVTVVLPVDGSTISLRAPGLPFLDALLERTGPLWSTSANPPGVPPSETAAGLHAQVTSAVDLCVDGGPARTTRPSTLVDLTGMPRVLREGSGDAGPLLDPPPPQT